MPYQFHEALHLLFQALAITGITPPSWLQSHTILLYKKGDPISLDNYRPITRANAIYKLWTTCIVIIATDYIESRKIPSPEQEGFISDRSCARAVTHLSLCVGDAHTSKKDIVLCYLDFKGVYPSTYHKQLVRVLDFLGEEPNPGFFRTNPVQSRTHKTSFCPRLPLATQWQERQATRHSGRYPLVLPLCRVSPACNNGRAAYGTCCLPSTSRRAPPEFSL